jgi:hypothetical protein
MTALRRITPSRSLRELERILDTFSGDVWCTGLRLRRRLEQKDSGSGSMHDAARLTASLDVGRVRQRALTYDPRTMDVAPTELGHHRCMGSVRWTASTDQIARALEDAHSGSRGTIASDVAAIVQQLCRVSPVRPSPVGAGPAR